MDEEKQFQQESDNLKADKGNVMIYIKREEKEKCNRLWKSVDQIRSLSHHQSMQL
jgi:hypothetical protein